MIHMSRPSILLPGVILVMVLGAAAALGAGFEESYTFDGDELKITNLIGKVDVRSTSGNEIRVTINVLGDDAEPGLIEFEAGEGNKAELHIIFPVDDHKKYVYPELGSGSKTTISFQGEQDGGSWLKKLFGGDKITVRGKGSGLEIWADVLVEVPKGRELEVKLGVGQIEAKKVQADLVLDTHSGAIMATGIKGNLLADTGSGSVTAIDIEGNVHVDTGSGKVELENCRSKDILVDTGSGSVKAEYLICSDLNIDTGSGSVRARRVEADDAKIDTGSGSVLLQLDRMGSGRFVLDTGSGSIELQLPSDASARIAADTGSGSMNNELHGAMVKNKSRREMSLVVGDGEATVILDAGSGSITVK